MLLAMDCKNYLISGLLAGVISLILLETTFSQYPGIDDDIEKYRKTGVRIITRPGAKVTVEQINHDFWFGCAISNIIASSGMPQKEKALYKEKFLENFNSAVTENAVKWPGMEPRKGLVNYATVDSILLWTEKNNIPLRAHNLFWGIEKFIQPWVKELGDDELRETLRKRAETVTSHYRGRFAEYDLNNEMIHGNYYEKRLGPQITSLMAQWAHNGDPDVQLYLNDYDILTGRMLPEYMSQIRTLLKQGVPVAGIGAQGHLHAETFDRVMLRKALDSLATFKLPVKITEFNIPGQRSKYYEKPTLKMTPQEEESAAREL
ncbi:MAG TPA: endo-1,4-beta-xylanase, partial [Bacteroidales bacterium]|nr:endo-1,4-beta-xylanase [Bacteroidales bacterium]